ncbi:hypothetical protein HX001_14230 [Empedobacter brevis]|uniref:Uncharacterized protein n=1 Tax=Empedobacter brevis TaxID=247 RepID=A0AAJ1QGG5_9FLAO|nr:hypothetical protein [Empedobacter brevis]MDM1073643.1 hypothetical protein [Empedobacter brevis]
MKKLLILFVIIPIFGFSQISERKQSEIVHIGKYNKGLTDYVMLERWNDNEIVVRFKNVKYEVITDYESFSFKDVDGAYDYFYKTLAEGTTSLFQSEKTLELPDEIIYINFQGSPLDMNANISVQSRTLNSKIDKLIPLNYNAINSIFGKGVLEKPKFQKETDYTTFNLTTRNSVYSRIIKYDEKLFLHLRFMMFKSLSNIPTTILKGGKTTIILDNGDSIVLLNDRKIESCLGCGSIGLSGSSTYGINTVYELSNDNINKLRNNKIVKYSIETEDGLIENELKPKKQEEFKKNLQTILD